MNNLIENQDGTLKGGYLSVTNGRYRIIVDNGNGNMLYENPSTCNPGSCTNTTACRGSYNGTCTNTKGGPCDNTYNISCKEVDLNVSSNPINPNISNNAYTGIASTIPHNEAICIIKK